MIFVIFILYDNLLNKKLNEKLDGKKVVVYGILVELHVCQVST